MRCNRPKTDVYGSDSTKVKPQKSKKNNFVVNYYQVTLIHYIYKCALAAEKTVKKDALQFFYKSDISFNAKQMLSKKMKLVN